MLIWGLLIRLTYKGLRCFQYPFSSHCCLKESVDTEKAIKLLEEAAAAGHDDAMNALGEIYEYGELGQIDYPTAIKHYKMAAEHGHPSAQVCSSSHCVPIAVRFSVVGLPQFSFGCAHAHRYSFLISYLGSIGIYLWNRQVSTY